MAWVFDPESGEYYDDGEYFTPELFGGSQQAYANPGNPWLPGMTGDYNKYGMEPYEQADINQALTGVDKVAKLLTSPGWNMMVANADPSADTMDWGALLPGGGVTGTNAGYGPQTGYGAGAGMGGGGGGMGAVGDMSMYMPTLLSSLQSPDPLLSDYAKRLQSGESPFQLQIELNDPSSGITSERMLDTYSAAIGRMAGELQTAQQQMMNGPQAQAGPLAQWYAKTGLPDPNQLYSADMLPGDIDVNQYLNPYQNQAADDLAMKRARAQAIYRSVAAPTEPFNPATAAATPDNDDGGLGPVRREDLALGDFVGNMRDLGHDLAPAARTGGGWLQAAGDWVDEDIRDSPLRDLQALGKDVASGVGSFLGDHDGNVSVQGTVKPREMSMADELAGRTTPSDWLGRGLINRWRSGNMFGVAPEESGDGFQFNGTGPTVGSPTAPDLSATPYKVASGRANGDSWFGNGKAPERYTNQAGRDVEMLQRRKAYHQDTDARTSQALRSIIADKLQQQGRTPAADRQAASLRLLRSMGVGI